MSSLDDTLKVRLDQIRRDSLYRQRKVLQSPQQPHIKLDGKDFLSFCSNDYLGLANHPELVATMLKAAETWGAGSCSSHLIIGHQQIHHDLEQALAEFIGYPRALLFSSGYMANMGTIKSLVGPGDHTFHDFLNHASLLDGGWFSRAHFQRFAHRDYDDLQKCLDESCRASSDCNRLIISDSVFSMDGDLANIPTLSSLANEYDSWLMIDDAHGLGLLGENGSGCLSHWSLPNSAVEIYVGTLGKAFGCGGAFVAGSKLLIETLIQRARTYIYTTAVPPIIAAINLKSLELVQKESWRREKLSELIDYFKACAGKLELPLMPSDTAIQPVLYNTEERTLQVSEKLAEEGILITAIRPPTVPKGYSRLRVTLTASHTHEDIDRLIRIMASI